VTADLDPRLRDALARAPEPAVEPDWSEVVARGRRPRRRLFLVAAVAAAAAGVAASPLGSTIADGFSGWLTGSPGAPAPAEEQREFRERDRRSSAPFPEETDLRVLIRAPYGGKTYVLYGFRTGTAVCLRLGGAVPQTACVAADELERSKDLAVPLVVDANVTPDRPGGKPGPRATFGLAAAEARRVVLAPGTRRALVGNGAFLHVGGPGEPYTTAATADDDAGRPRPVRLAPSLRDGVDFSTGLPLLGPTDVQRAVRGGRVAWFERREERGSPLPRDAVRLRMWGTFVRGIQPDPDDFLRVVVADRTGDRREICSALLTRGGVGGGCAPPATLFSRGPVSAGWTYSGVGRQFVILHGIASDDVARLELFLGTGDRHRVPLRDNVFATRVRRASFPARLVAYDAAGRVIGIQVSSGF
jgi:hypothetical protein